MQDTGKELWQEKRDILTHMLLMDSTGSGKTSAAMSLAYNALTSCTRVYFIVPKAEARLDMEIWQLARNVGSDDDFRALNHSTAQPPPEAGRLPNTINSFILGSAHSLTQLLNSLIPPSAGGSNSIFADKAMALIAWLMHGLTDLRDKGHLQLSVAAASEHLSAAK
ncbi:MAG: hypothetical protein LBR80_06240 [Deltaproteobacteria bacterium]|nr:hypothetical protein [Deltaproteobacteria bacterium]